MKNLIMKCIETFLIYILKVLNDMILEIFILDSPFHIKKNNLLYDFFDQSHV